MRTCWARTFMWTTRVSKVALGQTPQAPASSAVALRSAKPELQASPAWCLVSPLTCAPHCPLSFLAQARRGPTLCPSPPTAMQTCTPRKWARGEPDGPSWRQWCGS